MNCPRCGEVCRCHPRESSGPPSNGLVAHENTVVESQSSSPATSADRHSQEVDASAVSASQEDGVAWRDELTAKLSSYRARRKPRPPRYPSLRLRFEAQSSAASSAETAPSVAFETQSHQALALDGMTELPATAETDWEPASPEGSSSAASGRVESCEENMSARDLRDARANHGARIIEFPRSPEFERWEPAPPPSNELAGPVMTAPRILEAPEIVPPAPALGGITIEAVEPAGDQRRLGIDTPLQAAPLARRVAAAAVDGLIVALAASLFGLIFWEVTGTRPPFPQVLGLAIAVPCCLWAAYQYLLLVYAATTPGLRIAGLRLARFDGTRPNRRLRRWRVLAAYLSAVSLGMGYGWVFLDEDALCWHDRITHTYLAPKDRRT